MENGKTTRNEAGAKGGFDMDAARRRIETENLMAREMFVDLVKDVTDIDPSELANVVITTETGFKPFED